jgi:signal peptidase II
LRARAWPPAVGVILLAADQGTKSLAQKHLASQSIDLIGSLVRLRLTRNAGVAFGLLGTLVLPLSILAALILMQFVTSFWARLWRSPAGVLGLVMVIAGAVGNLADRLRLSFVIDFIQIGWWPTFNLADVWLVVGCALILIAHLRRSA